MRRFTILALFLTAAACAQTITIKTSTILDGKGGVLRDKTITISANKISSVGAAQGKTTYDLTGMTVMPGWIDTHTHPSWYFNKQDRLDQGGRGSKDTPAQSALAAEANVYATLLGGFTTIQSLGAAVDAD